ncbi:MAG: Fe2+-enterobactin ABC transporter substrate-binding protein [Actinomycetota bacterium]|nr:Fe2+-enterobactin ABC transporter substrate-binding protein [Actinomycetota bacterium]
MSQLIADGPRPRSRRASRHLWLAVVAALALLVAACGDDDDDASTTTTSGTEDTTTTTPEDGDTDEGDSEEESSAGGETVAVEHALGTTEVNPDEIERITSASVTLTGHMLIVDAPVVASMASGPGGPLADENGFFNQYAAVAVERGVEAIPGPEVNVEAIAATDPDLIIGSAVGGDAIDESIYDQLSQIAPTLGFDYSATSWQDATTEIATILGLEDAAAAAIGEFDALVAETSEAITVPAEPASAMVLSEDGANVFTPESPRGQLLQSLGFIMAELDEASAAEVEGGNRSDIVPYSQESLVAFLPGKTVFLVFADDSRIEEAAATPLGETDPFTEGRVYALGFESFRLDYYSATLAVERIAAALGS